MEMVPGMLGDLRGSKIMELGYECEKQFERRRSPGMLENYFSIFYILPFSVGLTFIYH
jgi:hypothetical protein